MFRERDKLDDDSLLYIAERSHLVQREGKCKPIEHLYSPGARFTKNLETILRLSYNNDQTYDNLKIIL